MGTALASPLYPIYQAQWHLQPSHITEVFVLYMVSALASLMLLGSLAGQRLARGLDRQRLQRLVSGLLLAVGAWFCWLLLA